MSVDVKVALRRLPQDQASRSPKYQGNRANRGSLTKTNKSPWRRLTVMLSFWLVNTSSRGAHKGGKEGTAMRPSIINLSGLTAKYDLLLRIAWATISTTLMLVRDSYRGCSSRSRSWWLYGGISIAESHHAWDTRAVDVESQNDSLVRSI